MINEDFQKGDERGEKDNKGCIQVQEERRGKGWKQWGEGCIYKLTATLFNNEAQVAWNNTEPC